VPLIAEIIWTCPLFNYLKLISFQLTQNILKNSTEKKEPFRGLNTATFVDKLQSYDTFLVSNPQDYDEKVEIS
jgi:hypothetical protein